MAFDNLIRITLGQYEGVDLQVFRQLAASLMGIGPIGIALAAYGQGNVPVAVMTVMAAWSMPITRRWPSILLQFIPVVASLLADQGDYSRSAALMAMARSHPASPKGWWDILALVQVLEDRLAAALSPEEYAAAQERGREMEVEKTAATLLEELKGMAAQAPSAVPS